MDTEYLPDGDSVRRASAIIPNIEDVLAIYDMVLAEFDRVISTHLEFGNNNLPVGTK